MTPLAVWVLLLMMSLAPSSPWLATFPRTAVEIAAASTESPMYDGPKGPAFTAALTVASGMHESSLRPDAVGDSGRSVCLLQIGVSNLAALGVTRRELLEDVGKCVRAGLKMMHASASVCRARPLEERQANYLEGNGGCSNETALRRSRWRTSLAKSLVAKHPPP